MLITKVGPLDSNWGSPTTRRGPGVPLGSPPRERRYTEPPGAARAPPGGVVHPPEHLALRPRGPVLRRLAHPGRRHGQARLGLGEDAVPGVAGTDGHDGAGRLWFPASAQGPHGAGGRAGAL